MGRNIFRVPGMSAGATALKILQLIVRWFRKWPVVLSRHKNLLLRELFDQVAAEPDSWSLNRQIDDSAADHGNSNCRNAKP